MFGRLAPLIRLIFGPKPSTEAWARGAEGEALIGHWLDGAVGRRGVVLHDRAIPRRRANLDHLVVVPSGIWVVDAKHYRGTLERRDSPGWFVPHPRLFVAGRDRSALVTAARRQQALVAEAIGGGTSFRAPVRAALCFTGVDRPFFTRPFTLEGVLVTWPRALAKALMTPGPLGPDDRKAMAALLARAFPPYAP